MRNICAHDNRLITWKLQENITYLPQLFDYYKIYEKDDKKSLYAVYLACKPFLGNSQFNTLKHTLKKRCQNLARKLHSIDINTVYDIMGFPHDWYAEKEENFIE